MRARPLAQYPEIRDQRELIDSKDHLNESDNNGTESARALLGGLDTYGSADSLSEESLRELFERHGLTSNNDTGNFNYGFFFRACKNESVNEGIIRLLFQNFPNAAAATDKDGWTPLHSACAKKT